MYIYLHTFIHIQCSGITNTVDLIKLGASDWSLHSGYLDEKPLISGNNTQGRLYEPYIYIYIYIYIYRYYTEVYMYASLMCIYIGEIHFRITIGNTKFLWLCGGIVKESLKHTIMYLDENVDISKYPNVIEQTDKDGINSGIHK
jgi:hypothetical protein